MGQSGAGVSCLVRRSQAVLNAAENAGDDPFCATLVLAFQASQVAATE